MLLHNFVGILVLNCPTSFLNSDYKLFSSLLVARLRDIISLIVNPSQMRSVPGQNIFSSIWLTRGLFGLAARTALEDIFSGSTIPRLFTWSSTTTFLLC